MNTNYTNDVDELAAYYNAHALVFYIDLEATQGPDVIAVVADRLGLCLPTPGALIVHCAQSAKDDEMRLRVKLVVQVFARHLAESVLAQLQRAVLPFVDDTQRAAVLGSGRWLRAHPTGAYLYQLALLRLAHCANLYAAFRPLFDDIYTRIYAAFPHLFLPFTLGTSASGTHILAFLFNIVVPVNTRRAVFDRVQATLRDVCEKLHAMDMDVLVEEEAETDAAAAILISLWRGTQACHTIKTY